MGRALHICSAVILFLLSIAGTAGSEEFRGKWWHYYQRGMTYCQEKKYDEAASDLKKALSVRDKDQRMARTYGMHFIDYFPHRELGIVYLGMGQLDKAISELEESVRSAESAKGIYYLNAARKAKLAASGPVAPAAISVLIEKGEGPLVTRARSMVVKARAISEAFIAKVTVNGVSYPIEEARREVKVVQEVSLDDEPKEITIVADDLAGNRATASLPIIVKRQGPSLAISSISYQRSEGREFARVAGEVHDSLGIKAIRIADTTQLAKGAKSFPLDLLVERKGAQSLLVSAEDMAGNETVAEVDLSRVIAAEGAARENDLREAERLRKEQERQDAEREAQRAAREKAERERAEAERLAREKAQQEELARLKIEAELKRAAEEKAAAEVRRLALETAAAERAARELEAARQAALARAEEQRKAREVQEQARLAMEKTRQEELARLQAEAQRKRLEEEQAAAEARRIAAEKAEAERATRELEEARKAAALQAEQERQARGLEEARKAAELKAEQQRLVRELEEARKAAALKAEQEQKARELEEARKAAELKAEQKRQARELEEARKAAELKAGQERKAREAEEQARAARERAEREEQARLKEETERKRLAEERAAAEAQRLAAEKAEAERVARELEALRKAVAFKAEQERKAREAEELAKEARAKAEREEKQRLKEAELKRQAEEKAAQALNDRGAESGGSSSGRPVPVEREKLKAIVNEQKLSSALSTDTDKQLTPGLVLGGKGTEVFVPKRAAAGDAAAGYTGAGDAGKTSAREESLCKGADLEKPILNLKDLGATPFVFVDSYPLDGMVTDNCLVDRVAVNGRDISIRKGRAVYFSSIVKLESGENSVSVDVFDAAGNKASSQITVTRKIPSVLQNGSRMSVLVLPFDYDSPTPSVRLASDYLIGAMTDQRRFLVVERQKLKQLMAERKLSLALGEDNEKAAQLGKVAAAEAIVINTARETDRSFEVTSRIVDTETTEVMAVLDVYTEDTSAASIKNLMTSLAAKIARNFPVVEGVVISRDDDHVLTDLGAMLKVRQRTGAIIYRKGKEIKHPATGKSLGFDTVKLGEGYLDEVQESFSKLRLGERYRDKSIESSDLVVTK